MKTDTLLIIAAAGLGLFFIAKVAKGMGASTSPASTGAGRATAVPAGINLFANAPMGGVELASLQRAYAQYDFGAPYGSAGYLGTTQ